MLVGISYEGEMRFLRDTRGMPRHGSRCCPSTTQFALSQTLQTPGMGPCEDSFGDAPGAHHLHCAALEPEMTVARATATSPDAECVSLSKRGTRLETGSCS